MGAVYTQLSMQERRRIEDMLNAKMSVDKIAAVKWSCFSGQFWRTTSANLRASWN